MPSPHLRALLAPFVLVCAIVAQAPPGYYATVDPSNAAALRATLHAVIDDHTKLPYTATSLDTWDVLELAWQDSANSQRIVDVYRNQSFAKVTDRVTGYNREHVWPKSYGFPNDSAQNYPYTDCHSLFLSDDGYNTSRSNLPFDDCTASCSEHATLATSGSGGGSGTYPGNSNWSTGGAGAFGTWEVWRGRRGDIARAMFYLDVRYEGGTHGGTGYAEPDLILTDNRSLIANSQTGNNMPVAYMGLLGTLLRWHHEDPVDARDMRRNDQVFLAQGNRNPFTDHPEWVDYLFGGTVLGSFTRYGIGCAGSNGTAPQISNSGDPLIGRSMTVLCGGAPAVRPAILNFDIQAQSVDLGPLGLPGCTALALPGIVVSATTNLFGTASLALPIPNDPQLVGQHLFAQWIVLDPQGRGAALTDGADVRFGRP